jgi:3',5'-cyclic AMP phosphodiesterase CpdA
LPNPLTIKLAHFSDIHVSSPNSSWKAADWFNKRLPGWFNLRCLGRGHRFSQAETVLHAFMQDIRERRPDHIVFSGDASALGFEAEIERAAQLLLLSTGEIPGIAVPGNHDYYTRAAAASGDFERNFTAWQIGKRVDGSTYPFAQRVGHVWLIAVNSCTGNRLFWDAGGAVGGEQLERLETLLADLDDGPRILVTHYPVCLANGRPEKSHHGLRDLAALLAVASRGKIGLWLHGHRHHPYQILLSDIAPFPMICTGSATQLGISSYGEYSIEGSRLRAERRGYLAGKNCFEVIDRFEFELR